MSESHDKYHYRFIHNVLGDYFNECSEHFGTYLHSRFKYKVVSSYDKAVEFLNKKAQYGQETDMPNLPAFILDPVGEMNIAQAALFCMGSARERCYVDGLRFPPPITVIQPRFHDHIGERYRLRRLKLK